MSAYIDFYIKGKSGEFTHIGTFSRSSEVFSAISDYVPYGKNIPLTCAVVREVINEIDARIKSYNEMIENDEKTMAVVGTFNNSVEDKMEEIYHLRSSIAETKEELKWINDAAEWYHTLSRMIYDAEDSKFYSNPDRHYDPDDFIYVGYEAGWPGREDEEED